MRSYAVRRLALVPFVVWGAVTVLFLLFFVLPGDPVQQLVGERAVPETVRANIEARYGLDQPLYVQYGRYWGQVATGDLGESYQSRRSVNAILADTGAASLRLALWALVIEVVVGVVTGVVSAVRRYSFVDALTTVSTTMLVAVPVFVLGYLLQYAFGVFTFQRGLPEWLRFPVQGIGPDSWALFLWPTNGQWRHLILPALTLASVSTALVARLMRTTMLETLRADYMRTARAKGLSERQVVLGHGLRNAMIPVVTYVGLDLGVLIGSAVLTETVFNWPGMGTAIYAAILAQDAPVVLGLVLVLVLAYIAINLLVDLSYGLFDPRIRYGDEAGSA
ncbi:MAG: ABC transporter permease [Actinomycetota bacterium]|nr:ABC transporter permease [Actinomycetota bacterium]